MDLLVTNAETYSKSDSDLVKKARKLVASMRIELDHDLKHLGKSKDRISLLEEVIRKK